MSVRRFFRRGRWDDERARELEAHLAIEIDENVARGMTPADARLAARRKLGNATLVREEIYQMNTIALVDSAWRDLTHGARLLRLNPGFAAADDYHNCSAPSAVVSYGFWQRELGGEAAAIGRTIVLERHAYPVIGVTPPQFFGVEVGRTFDVALPLCAEPLGRVQSGLDK